MSICDFGTSNSTLGTIAGREPVLTALEAAQTLRFRARFYALDIGLNRPASNQNGVVGRPNWSSSLSFAVINT